MTAKDIKRRAERVKVDAALRFGVPTLASVAFVAVRVLKSGDVCFTMRSAKEAEIARTHQGFCKEDYRSIDQPNNHVLPCCHATPSLHKIKASYMHKN
jgi:hypothetical protein